MQDLSILPMSVVDRVEEATGKPIDLRAPLRLEPRGATTPSADKLLPDGTINPQYLSLWRQCRANDTQWGSLRPRGSQLQRKHRRPALQRFNRLRAALSNQYGAARMNVGRDRWLSEKLPVCEQGIGMHRFCTALDMPSALRLLNALADMVRPRVDSVPLHPCVEDALKVCAPRSMRVLLMQWPTPSDEVPNALCYTQTLYKLAQQRWTRTTPGKYLREHFPQLTDDEIRDIVARHTVSEDRFGITNNMDEMLKVLANGPRSCMRIDEEDLDSAQHPYTVYSPAMGWALAFLRAAHHTPDCPCYDARALVNHESKTFVRTYKRSANDGYSNASEELHQWLVGQGFRKADSWNGRTIARIPSGSGLIAPYIDGTEQGVYGGSVDWLTIGRTDATPNRLGSGDNTNGLLSQGACCDHCGDTEDPEDMYSIGGDDNRLVCNSCCTTGSNRNGNYAYVIHHSGDYVIAADDAVWLCSEWYDKEDDCVFYCDYSQEYVHIDDTWPCDYDGERYADSVAHTTLHSTGVTIADHQLTNFLYDQVVAGSFEEFVEFVDSYSLYILPDATRVVRGVHAAMDNGHFDWRDEPLVAAYNEIADYAGIDARTDPDEEADEDEEDDAEAARNELPAA